MIDEDEFLAVQKRAPEAVLKKLALMGALVDANSDRAYANARRVDCGASIGPATGSRSSRTATVALFA